MRKVKTNKRMHIGGEQLLLIPPTSDWQAPTSLPDLRQGIRRIALDTETRDDGLNSGWGGGWAVKGKGNLIGISIAWRTDGVHARYFPLAHPDSQCFQPDQLRRWIADHRKAGVRFAFHSAQYDLGWLRRDLGLPLEGEIDDTSCMAYMVDENRLSYSLDNVCRWLAVPAKNEEKLREAASAYGRDPKKEMYKLPARFVGEYAEQDAASTLMAAEKLDPLIDRDEVRDAYQLEMDLVPLVHEMRWRGVRIDMEAADRAYDKFKKQSAEALAEITDKLSHTVEISHLRDNGWMERVFAAEGINFPRSIKTNQGSFEAKWMKGHPHWLPKLCVRAKQREEAAEKFIRNYICSFAVNGRLHSNVHQYRTENLEDAESYGGGTRTYRFSYSDPPLQQMPQRDEELAKVIRGCFLPEKGEEWCSADYSQQEYRLIVHYAFMMKFPRAAEAAAQYQVNPDTDFHQFVADMTGLERKPAKDANFAKAYGAGVRKFSIMIKKSFEEAARIMRQYDEKLPFVQLLYEHCDRRAQKNGYIKLLDGARIRFDLWTAALTWEEKKHHYAPDCDRAEAERRIQDPNHVWHGKRLVRSRTHKALNSLIQGGAARQTKIAMRGCWRASRVPMLQVHDELCFSVGSKSQVAQITDIMRSAVPLAVPMMVDAECGANWGSGG